MQNQERIPQPENKNDISPNSGAENKNNHDASNENRNLETLISERERLENTRAELINTIDSKRNSIVEGFKSGGLDDKQAYEKLFGGLRQLAQERRERTEVAETS